MTSRKPYTDDEAIEPWEIESENFVDDAEKGGDSEFRQDVVKANNNGYQGQSFCSGMTLYISVFTFVFALLAFVAFDQGIVVVPDSELAESVPSVPGAVLSPTNSMELKWWDKKEMEKMEMLSRKQTAWEKAMAEADEILSKGSYKDASCLLPNTAKTATLVNHAKANPHKTQSNTALKKSSDTSLLPLPVLNMGMPKCGTTSAYEFFKCAGYKATHSVEKSGLCPGLCMRDSASIGLPVLENCAMGDDSLLEMDCVGAFGTEYKNGAYHSPKMRDDCFYPQLSLLEEFHDEDPNATFLLEFRPIDDWIDSFKNWLGPKITEIMHCDFPNMPRGVPNVKDDKDVHDQSVRFICSHVIHVRNFVEAHPSHALVEIDLYDNDTNGEVLGTLFPSTKDNSNTAQCWGHASHGKDLHSGDMTVGKKKAGQGNGQQKGGQGNGQQNKQLNGQKKGGQGNGQKKGGQGNGQKMNGGG